MMFSTRRLCFAVLLFAAGCGDGGGGDGATAGSVEEGDVGTPSANAGGGSSSGGAGGAGGRIEVYTWGTVDVGAAPSPAPAGPPAGGTELTSGDLGADVARPGHLFISGDATTSGAGSVRSITSLDGDIVVSGVLRGGDLGATTQGVALRAPRGTVFVTGAVITSSSDGAATGDAPGAVTVEAAQVVVGGVIRAQGESNDAGAGGPGGTVSLAAGGGPVHVSGGVHLRGGAAHASGRGGRGGTLGLWGSVPVRLHGVADVRGGRGAEGGGDGGLIRVGGPGADVASVELGAGPHGITGGEGATAGGAGGAFFVHTSGDIRAGGAVDASGGDSAGSPGGGGSIHLWADVGGGNLTVSGSLTTRGGSATGGSAGGGSGGKVHLWAYHPAVRMALTGASVLTLDGGNSTGAGTAGGGGMVHVDTSDAPVSLGGSVLARGGAALGAGGTGGRGGNLSVTSDNNASGVGGDITIETSGFIDASGGPGAVGGSARCDLTDSANTNPERSAVALDSDSGSIHNSGGVIQNLGRIVARGGAENGWGGDVSFHGRGVTTRDPEPGDQDRSAHGTGKDGDWLSD